MITIDAAQAGRITTVVTIVGGMLVLGAFALVDLLVECSRGAADLEEHDRLERERDREALAQLVRIDAGLAELDRVG